MDGNLSMVWNIKPWIILLDWLLIFMDRVLWEGMIWGSFENLTSINVWEMPGIVFNLVIVHNDHSNGKSYWSGDNEFNHAMNSVRISIEWSYMTTGWLFPSLKLKSWIVGIITIVLYLNCLYDNQELSWVLLQQLGHDFYLYPIFQPTLDRQHIEDKVVERSTPKKGDVIKINTIIPNSFIT